MLPIDISHPPSSQSACTGQMGIFTVNDHQCVVQSGADLELDPTGSGELLRDMSQETVVT